MKDNYATVDMPTTGASKALDGFRTAATPSWSGSCATPAQ